MDKLYKDMTAAEQLSWLTDFSKFADEKLARLDRIGDVWEQCSIKDMEEGLRLINAFAYARDYVKNSLCFQDYSRRVSRLSYYVDRIKQDLAKGMTVRGAGGETYAYIPALQGQSRRRGRPTREEQLARAMGKTDEMDEQDEELQKNKKIAALLGIPIVTATPKREKNNAELAAERAERDAKADANQQSLFDDLEARVSDNENNVSDISDRVDELEQKMSEHSLAIVPTIGESMPRLAELKWLLSDGLASEVDNVRNYRATAAASAEKAKTMAEMGVKPDDVKVYTMQAADMTERYERVLENVDRELAIMYVRLREDENYTSRFMERHHLRDVTNLIDMLKPYFKKQDDDFVNRVRKIIDDENPEKVAQREKEKQTKKEVDAIVKYLMRTDKKASSQRVKTMEERILRLEELRGKEFADTYRPVLEKTRREAEQ